MTKTLPVFSQLSFEDKVYRKNIKKCLKQKNLASALHSKWFGNNCF